jgi:hypothetical protein
MNPTGQPDRPIDPEREPLAGAELRRLAARDAGLEEWDRWGPYLSDRQWGTVREDYSADGDAWGSFPHDHARSRAYRWGEDGLLGISDDQAQLCFAIVLWNERDPILKERLFGLTGPEGNHGEDVKEAYWYVDATPSHAYLKARYRYPIDAFPYVRLIDENRARGKDDPEFELVDTGVFDGHRFVDALVEYAKAAPTDILVRITLENHAAEAAPIHLLPHLWFRNTWSWGRHHARPSLMVDPAQSEGGVVVRAEHVRLGVYRLVAEGSPELLFTENETNVERLWAGTNPTPFVKDGIGRSVVDGDPAAVNSSLRGTKMAIHYRFVLEPGERRTVHLRLGREIDPEGALDGIGAVFQRRIAEADAFYAGFGGDLLSADERAVQRAAFAGLIWGKQLYHFDVGEWLDGDPAFPPPPASRLAGRNSEWREFNALDVLSMPDPWEYPWFAAWDLAFHCIPLALLDPGFAKRQLVLLTREWYMHANGQLPAYEWQFSDVNPPVHAWAAWRVYKIEKRRSGHGDRDFLERIFLKLLLNFTWWVNRKDADGHNVFQGGFLGLDNIGVFDRSKPLPVAGHLGQADGTAWMGMYCLNMLAIALELASEDRVYEDVATKFFEHFLYIAGALNDIGGSGIPLWNDEDQFFYDVIHLESGEVVPLEVRSMVGLIPLLAVETLEPGILDALPEFRRRMRWFLANRPALASLVASWEEPGLGARRLLALVHGHRMKALLRRVLDSDEFLSDHGIRSLSKAHEAAPYVLSIGGEEHVVRYEPAESRSGLFGGNSNWRGPVWFPMNFLIIEALQKFHHYYGPDFKVDYPTGSGRSASLDEIAHELSARLTGVFTIDADGHRPYLGRDDRLRDDPLWRDNLLFHEYFDGDTAAGLGASHQTGWTALVAKLLEQRARRSAVG